MQVLISDLVVEYGASRAVDGLCLSVPNGSLFGLLGPNGAGKSSTIRCVATVQTPKSGSIRVGDVDAIVNPTAARPLLGVVPQGLALYESLTVRENLRLFAGLFGVAGGAIATRVDWGLSLSQLADAASKPVQTLSGGMKRRLNIAAALLHDPKVIILDEPTTGVDPQSRNHIFETIRTLHREGRTIVYTTHYMEEVETLCDHVAIVDRGKLVLAAPLATVLERAQPRSFEVTMKTPASPDAIRGKLESVGLHVERVRGTGRTLEEVFLELTGRDLRDAP